MNGKGIGFDIQLHNYWILDELFRLFEIEFSPETVSCYLTPYVIKTELLACYQLHFLEYKSVL